jgi:septal ring factor EnvC (AmiA/AmiB activator)
MPTMAPPEETMQERWARVDERFDRTDERIKEVNRRITETSAETNRRLDEIKDLKLEMKTLQVTFQRGNFALVASVISVLLATILKGG